MSRIGRAYAAAHGVAAKALAWTAPAVPGIGSTVVAQPQSRVNAEQQRRAESRDALYGRTTYRSGPIPSWVSSYPMLGLTPARIKSIHNAVLTTGYMVDKACLDEDMHVVDGHMVGVDRAVRVAVTGKPFTMEPASTAPEEAELARALADYCQAWIDDCDGFASSCYELLYGNGAGYAVGEAVYQDKAVRFPYGTGMAHVYGPHPRQIDHVSNKHTTFDPDTGLLKIGGADSLIVPQDVPHKFPVYVTPGDFQVRRRGFLYQCIWYTMLKVNAIARWGAVLDIWGLRAPIGEVDPELYQDDTRRERYESLIQEIGTGKAALITSDLKIQPTPEVTADARGMHAAIIGWANTEQSKLIQGETLTTEMGGVGAYNASETHAAVKESIVRMYERALSDCMRRFARAVVRLNIDALAAALGATPEAILRVIPRPYWRVDREVTPEVRMRIYDQAVNTLGLEVDSHAVYREFGLPKARSKDSAIKGKVTTLPEGASAVTAIDATQGAAQASEQVDTAATATATSLELTATDTATIVTVNEARLSKGLPPIEGGAKTIAEYRAELERQGAAAPPQPAAAEQTE